MGLRPNIQVRNLNSSVYTCDDDDRNKECVECFHMMW